MIKSEFKSFHQHQFRWPVWIYSHHCFGNISVSDWMENRKWHPEKSAAKLANHDYQNGMKWKNRDIPTRAPNTSLDQLRSQVHRGDSRGGPGQKSADTIFGSNDKTTFSNDGMTISNDNRNCNIQYNDNNVKFQAPK